MHTGEMIKEALFNEFWGKETDNITRAGLVGAFVLPCDKKDGVPPAIEIRLDREDCDKVKKICNSSELLIFNFYAAVLSLLLNRYFPSGIAAFSGAFRQFSNDESDDTFFLYKCDIEESMSFKELFTGKKNFLTRSLSHRGLPENIQNAIGDDRFVNLREFALATAPAGETAFDNYPPQVLFTISERADEHYLDIRPTGVRWNTPVVRLFGQNFANLLGEVIGNIYTPLASLEFRCPEERALLQGFQNVESLFSLDRTLVELIAEQARSFPDKIAIECGTSSIRYADLDAGSSELGNFLRTDPGGQTDSLYGVMMERGIAMAECILGIWKAGAAYVPIDMHNPVARISHIIEVSGLKALFVDRSVPQAIIEELALKIPVIDIEQQDLMISELSCSFYPAFAAPTDLAYVIYTSGSTGQPKGVMIEQGGMLNHIGSKIVEMGISSVSRVAQNAPHTFDISVWQLFAALAAGGTTVIYDDAVVNDPLEFTNRIAADQISVLELVPSYLTEMLQVLETGALRNAFYHLKILVLNAETLMPSMVKRWLTLYPAIPIVNTYGATEASDDISHYIMHELPMTATVPVMSRPIQNFEVHLVDGHIRQVPIGAIGEILLCGPAVGRGYLNDAEKTAQAFLKGPLQGVTNQTRIYRTGDLGRRWPDGTMEFLGRKDSQVKIRGHRIELGEVEHALLTVTGVENCVVLANQNEQYLAAYYQSDQLIAPEQLLNSIGMTLPEYMLPHYFVWFEKLPLTPNGKIDKKRLPDPAFLQGEHVVYTAPRNEMEQRLAILWEEILGREKIGVMETFTQLGGHSLKAMKLMARIHREFNVKVKLEDILNKATIEDMAMDISRKLWIRQGKEEYREEPELDKSFIL